MTLHFFSRKPSEGDANRNRAVTTVSTWLWRKTHLPKDLIAALHTLITELKREHDREADDFSQD